MTWVPVVLTRRTLLIVTGVALVGACGSPAKKATSPARPVPAGHPDPVRDRALSTEAALIAQYDAALALPTVAADSGLAAKLTAIRTEHAAHAAAIKDGYVSTPTPTPTPMPSTPPAPTDAKTAVAKLAKAEQDAASARTTDIMSADGSTAMLLASIAASESGHVALLLGGAA